MLAFISLAASVVAVILAVVGGTSSPGDNLGEWASLGAMILALVGAVLGAIALIRKQGPKWAAIAGLAIGAFLLIGVIAVGLFG